MSLLPESMIAVSPNLAATLGLEEAVMLAVLLDLQRYGEPQQRGDRSWLTIDNAKLLALLPFWTADDIHRVLRNLVDKGVMLQDSPPFNQSSVLRFSLEQGASFEVSQRTVTPAPTGKNQLITPHWQPSEEILRAMQQLNGVDSQFALQQVSPFVIYWTEAKGTAPSWNNKFRQWVLRAWRERDSDFLSSRRDDDIAMYREWRPSLDAVEILERSGISPDFIEESIPEFVLYWTERGESSKTWNSKFIKHIRMQWARFTAAIQYDSEPRVIDDNWQPSADVYDILVMANIDNAFAQAQLPEFVMYWRDSKQPHVSWNSKFLQHVKYRWAQRHQMPLVGAGRTHETRQGSDQASGQKADIVSRLTDRSWAQG